MSKEQVLKNTNDCTQKRIYLKPNTVVFSLFSDLINLEMFFKWQVYDLQEKECMYPVEILLQTTISVSIWVTTEQNQDHSRVSKLDLIDVLCL